jgi:hypothetical protein
MYYLIGEFCHMIRDMKLMIQWNPFTKFCWETTFRKILSGRYSSVTSLSLYHWKWILFEGETLNWGKFNGNSAAFKMCLCNIHL